MNRFTARLFRATIVVLTKHSVLMPAGNGSTGRSLFRSSYWTVVGILVLVSVLLTVFEVLTSTPKLRHGLNDLAQSTRHAATKVLFYVDSCTNCQEGDLVFADFEDFAERELERAKCLADIRSRLVEDYRPLFENVTKVALIDVALHTNLGDSILWRSAIHVATWFGHTIDYVCAKSQAIGGHLASFPRCDLNTLATLTRNHGLIMYHAGGNWGDLYRFVQDYRMKTLWTLGSAYRSKLATFKIVQLPQSIAYTPTGASSRIKDSSFINNLPSGMFTLMTRQDDSYGWALRHYKENIDIRLSPDIAFALGQLSPLEKPSIDVMFIMRGDREDKEKGTGLKEEVAKRFNGTGLTYSFQGYNYTNYWKEYASAYPTVMSEVRLNAVIRTISKGKVLVTNRFHGHIIAMMVGRTTFWTDTVQKKMTHTRNVAFSTSKHCSAESMRSFEYPSTLEAVDAAIEHLLRNRT